MKRLCNGIVKENPVFVLLAGMCPALAVTTAAGNGLAMGLIFTAVLLLCNLIVSALRDAIPPEGRLPARILILAALVSVAELCAEAFCTPIYDALGIYLPLLVLTGIALDGAETLPPQDAVPDALGKGLGFTLALTLVGALRELLGSGTIFGTQVFSADVSPVGIFAQPPGAFLTLALLIAILNAADFGQRRRGWEFPTEIPDEQEEHS